MWQPKQHVDLFFRCGNYSALENDSQNWYVKEFRIKEDEAPLDRESFHALFDTFKDYVAAVYKSNEPVTGLMNPIYDSDKFKGLTYSSHHTTNWDYEIEDAYFDEENKEYAIHIVYPANVSGGIRSWFNSVQNVGATPIMIPRLMINEDAPEASYIVTFDIVAISDQVNLYDV